MNASRRKALRAFSEKLADLRTELEEIKDAESDFYDNLSEKQQDGEKGDISQSAISVMEEALASIEEAGSNLEDLSVEEE